MKKKFLSALIMASLTLTSSIALANGNVKVNRLSGNDRYDTSMNIGNEVAKNLGKLDSIILASGENFPDALSGTTLCKKYNAPLLLINSGSKNKVLSFLHKNLRPNTTVYALGGEASISEDILKELRSRNYTVKRISGDDRFKTNNKIVDEMKVKSGTPVFICNSYGFADALSASPVAGAKQYPIILVGQNTMSKDTEEQIKSINPSTFYVIGGTGSVSKENVNKLLSICPKAKCERIGGNTRYETSEMINTKFNLSSIENIALANGQNFPDAISGAALASIKGEGIKLADKSVKNIKFSKNIKNVDVFGGEVVLPNNLINSLITLDNSNIENKQNVEKNTELNNKVPNKITNKVVDTNNNIKPNDKVELKNNISSLQTNGDKLNAEYKKAVTNKMFQLVNALRTSQGRGNLNDIQKLDSMAENRSKYMAQTGEFSHEDRNGNFILADDLKRVNYSYKAVGENIVQNFYDSDPNKMAEKLFIQWKNSPGHYKNMISESFNQMGFGIAITSDNKVYATQAFVGK